MAQKQTKGNAKTRKQLEERVETLEELRRTEHDQSFAGDQRDMTGDISQASQHPADVADFAYQRELTFTTTDILDREAQQARDALARQAAGAYGICVECGKAIAPERLQARPEATRCVDCQRQLEEGHPA